MRSIHQRKAASAVGLDRLWWAMAGASVAAALVVAIAAVQAWSAWPDPHDQWLAPVEMVMQ
jgi:hypothetical protein